MLLFHSGPKLSLRYLTKHLDRFCQDAEVTSQPSDLQKCVDRSYDATIRDERWEAGPTMLLPGVFPGAAETRHSFIEKILLSCSSSASYISAELVRSELPGPPASSAGNYHYSAQGERGEER